VDVILLCGPTGAGKTTTAFEMSRMLAASGVTHAVIDTDELDRVYPQPSSESELIELTSRNLMAVWESYASLGHHRLILCGVMLDSAAATRWIAEALGNPKITVVRLVATESTLEARIMVREIGSGRQHHLQTAVRQAAQLGQEVRLNEKTVVTDGRTPIEVAGDVLGWAGWDVGPGYLPADVEVADYDPSWSTSYAEEAALLVQVFGSDLLKIEHVGSTSVPGVAAKPVIDMLGDIDEHVPFATVVDRLSSAGYLYTPEIQDRDLGRRVFRKGPTDMAKRRTHHLHVSDSNGRYWRRMVAFRDYLRIHPDEALRYVALKRNLAQQFTSDPDRYTAAKANYVQDVVERAGVRWS
jgi:GrpB-like predicted nucleotidyltransferase (UPF0157 family)